MEPSKLPLHRLVNLVYRAAVDSSAWQAFLTESGRLFDSHCVWLMLWDSEQGASSVAFAGGDAGLDGMRSYNAYYGARNPLVRRHAQRFMRSGVINLSQARMPLGDFNRTEFYNDFCRPMDVSCAVGACISDDDGHCIHISWLRSRSRGLFGRREVRVLQPLLSHLQRAVRIHALLSNVRQDADANSAALDRLATGVVVMNRRAHVLFANRTGAELLHTGGDLNVTQKHKAQPSTVARRLGDIATQALAMGHDTSGALPVVTLRQPDRPTLAVTTVPRHVTGTPDARDVVTLLVNPVGRLTSNREFGRQRYGFSDREAAVVDRLVRGETLAEAAEHLGVALETVRSHLKSVFRKTGANRQTQLVALMARSEGHIR